MRNAAARYYVTSLPTLGEFGSKPPLSLGEFRGMLADQAWTREPVDAVLLLDDLTQRESFLSGESAEVSPTVLTPAQVRNEAPLPDRLQPADEDAETTGTSLEVDRLWGRYFRFVVALSRTLHCPFLKEWAAFEVGLRNALAVARAEGLGLPGEDYRVATQLDQADEDFAEIVDAWTRADTPLSGWRLLIRARWQWANKHARWFTFRQDELAAYAVKLMLLHQAHRLNRFEEQLSERRAGASNQQEGHEQ